MNNINISTTGSLQDSSKKDAQKASCTSLPEELLGSIFSFLDQNAAGVMGVSHSWNHTVVQLQHQRDNDSLKKQYGVIQNDFISSVITLLKELQQSEQLVSDDDQLNVVYQELAKDRSNDLTQCNLATMKSINRNLTDEIIDILTDLASDDLVKLEEFYDEAEELRKIPKDKVELFTRIISTAYWNRRYSLLSQATVDAGDEAVHNAQMSQAFGYIFLSKLKLGVLKEEQNIGVLALIPDTTLLCCVVELVRQKKILDAEVTAENIIDNIEKAKAYEFLSTTFIIRRNFTKAMECANNIPIELRKKETVAKVEASRKLREKAPKLGLGSEQDTAPSLQQLFDQLVSQKKGVEAKLKAEEVIPKKERPSPKQINAAHQACRTLVQGDLLPLAKTVVASFKDQYDRAELITTICLELVGKGKLKSAFELVNTITYATYRDHLLWKLSEQLTKKDDKENAKKFVQAIVEEDLRLLASLRLNQEKAGLDSKDPKQ